MARYNLLSALTATKSFLFSTRILKHRLGRIGSIICDTRKTLRCCGIVLGVLFAPLFWSFGQTTGSVLGDPVLQKYISVGGGIDEINTGDLTVHVSIPLASKGSYGPPVSASLNMDSRTYMANYNNQGNRIFSGQGFAIYSSPDFAASLANFNPGGGNCGTLPLPTASAYPVYDGSGTSHPVLATATGCGGAFSTGPDGWSVVIGLGGPDPTGLDGFDLVLGAVSPSGLKGGLSNTKIGSCFPHTVTDLHGNQIIDAICGSTNSSGIINGESGSITDAAGNPVLTASLSANNVILLKYPGPNGTTSQYKLTYTAYTINSDFGCAGLTVPPSYAASLLTQIVFPDTSVESFTYETNSLHAGTITGRIASISVPTGAKYTYTYTGGSHGVNCSDGTTSGINKSTPDGIWTITHTAATGSANLSTTNIRAPSGDYVVDTTASVPPNFATPFVIPQMSTVASLSYNSSGTLLSSKYICYNGYHPASPTACANPPSAPGFAITETDTWTYVPGVANPSLKVSLFDNYLRLVDEKTYDFGGTVGSSNFDTDVQTSYGSSNGSSCSPITFSIAPFGTATLLDRVCTKATYVFGGALANYQLFTYGTSGGNLGELIQEQAVVGGSLVTVDRRTYDSLGRVLTSTGPNGETTTYAYTQCSGQQLSSVSVEVNSSGSTLSTSYSGYDCVGEIPTITTDANTHTTTKNFGTDPFWRPVSITDPAGTVTNYLYTIASGSNPAKTDVQTTITSGSSSETLTQYDSMGRVKLTESRQGPSSTQYTIVETDYDNDGRVVRVTLPYSGSAGQLNSTIDGTKTTYDGLGRELTVTDPAYSGSVSGSITSYAYNANDTLVTVSPAPVGEQAKSRQIEQNGLGEITSVCEITSLPGSGSCGQSSPASGFETAYAYYPGGQLKSVTQGANGSTQQIRSFTYDNDNTGRLLTSTTPEAGTTATVYDSDPNGACPAFIGFPIKTVDNAGGTSCFQYDLADRVTTENFLGFNASATSTKNFIYDTSSNPNFSCTAKNAAGKLAEISTGNAGAATPGEGVFTIVGREQVGAIGSPTPGTGFVTISGTEGSTMTSPPTRSSGTVTVNGSLQSKVQTTTATFSHGTLSIGGGPDQSMTFDPCSQSFHGSCPQTVWNSGTIAVMINGYQATAGYGATSTVSSIASDLASSLNGSTSVTATASGGNVIITSRITGSSTNYTFTTTVSYYAGNQPNGQPFFSGPPFQASSGALSGGADGTSNTVYDSGATTITINSQPISYSWSGSGTSAASIAQGLASAINSSSLYATATSSGPTISLTSRTLGPSTNYSLSSSSTHDSNNFSTPSFGTSNPGNMTGGTDPTFAYDRGTTSITANGHASPGFFWAQYDTAATIAVGVCNEVNADGAASVIASTVPPSSVGISQQCPVPSNNPPNYIYLQAKSPAPGTLTDYTLSASTTSQDNSFSSSASGPSLTGAISGDGFDTGTVSATIGNFTATVSYGQFDTPQSIAASLTSFFNNTAGSPVTATPTGVRTPLGSNLVIVKTTSTGSGANFNTSGASATNYPSVFSSPSFVAVPEGTTLAGGGNANVVTSDEGFCYDPDGRPTDTYLWTANGYNAYGHISESYYNNGVPQSISFGAGWPSPVPPTINYTLDPMGRPNAVSDSNSHTLVSGTTYNLDDTPNVVSFGNGDNSTYTEYANFAPQAAINAIGTSTNNKITYTSSWNSNGTVQSLQTSDNFNSTNSQTCNFSYDDLVRISTDNCGTNWSASFAYDPFGNLTRSGSAFWPPAGATYNQSNNHYSGSAFAYDANGRLLNDTFDTLGWDANGNLISQTGTTFTYDAIDSPLSSTLAGATVSYVYAPDGSLIASLIPGTSAFSRFFAPLPASRAVYTGASPALDHIDRYDWQGSARISSTWGRAPYDDVSYDAFGMPYWNSGATNNQYAGLNSDVSSGTEEVSDTRRYHPSQGRWESPDDIIPDIYNPQTFNAYHYALNMPTGTMDPGGEDEEPGISIIAALSFPSGYQWTADDDENLMQRLAFEGIQNVNKMYQSSGIDGAWYSMTISAEMAEMDNKSVANLTGGNAAALSEIQSAFNQFKDKSTKISLAIPDFFNTYIQEIDSNIPFFGVHPPSATNKLEKSAVKAGFVAGFLIPGGEGEGVVAGEAGRFGTLSKLRIIGDELEAHHMPQVKLNFTSRADGGALVMTAEEHAMTRNYGARGIATARAETGLPFRTVMARDIRDVRSIVGSKYNEGLQKLLQYYGEKYPALIAK